MQTLEEYINTSTDKHFYNCYSYSSNKKIKNNHVTSGFDIDIKGALGISLKAHIIFSI